MPEAESQPQSERSEIELEGEKEVCQKVPPEAQSECQPETQSEAHLEHQPELHLNPQHDVHQKNDDPTDDDILQTDDSDTRISFAT